MRRFNELIWLAGDCVKALEQDPGEASGKVGELKSMVAGMEGVEWCDFLLQNRMADLSGLLEELESFDCDEAKELRLVCSHLLDQWKRSEEHCPDERLEAIYMEECKDFEESMYGNDVGNYMLEKMERDFVHRGYTRDGDLLLTFNDLCHFHEVLLRAERSTDFGKILYHDSAILPYQIARRARRFRWGSGHDNVVEWRYIVMKENMRQIIQYARRFRNSDGSEDEREMFAVYIAGDNRLHVRYVANSNSGETSNSYFSAGVNEREVVKAIKTAIDMRIDGRLLIRYKYQWRALYEVLSERTVQTRPWIQRHKSDLHAFCDQMQKWFPQLRLTYKSLSHGGAMRGDSLYDMVFNYFSRLFKEPRFVE